MIDNFASLSGKINERDIIAKTMMYENEPLGPGHDAERKAMVGYARENAPLPPPPFFCLVR